MKRWSDEELEHIELLHAEFCKPEFDVIRKELQKYKQSLVNFMTNLHVENEKDRMDHIRYSAKLELVDMWLEMPEKTRTILEKVRSIIPS